MTPLLFVRAAVSSLVVAALVMSIVVATVVCQRAAAPLVIVVPAAAPAPMATSYYPVDMHPGVCYGYDWRRSSIDLRWYCGYRD